MPRLLPSSLTGRVVAATVALVAVLGIVITAATTVALRSYLTGQLDDQVAESASREVGVVSGGPLRRRGLPTIDGAFQDTRTVTAYLAGNASIGGVVTSTGEREALSDGAMDALAGIMRDEPQTVELPGLGSYRALAREVGPVTVVSGLPTDEVDETVTSVRRLGTAFSLGGVLVAGAVGLVVVRCQLRPLRQVARTAHEVAGLPLASGEVGVTARVPDSLTDERTEVGRVGAALNTLLGQVEQALDQRHRSEQRVRQFVADASHELRTPLATINGYAELSRRTTAPDAARLGHAMGKVEVEAARMSSLVEDLLLLARLDSGRPLERAEVDLTRLVLETVGDVRVLSPSHRWVMDLGEEPVIVPGDEQRLHQVVTNLLNNARRHTPEGTTVTVGAHLSDDGGEAVLRVADNGPGIAPELGDSVFA
ncbi:MAG TPA: histidine kinase dimerization/phospho-acceptor domain-containing protein, partial [Intrasporangium sp.]|nr:histidine kinase dimerization/phospho-acceptor domain-containing protein [Intrasporangium sp.]